METVWVDVKGNKIPNSEDCQTKNKLKQQWTEDGRYRAYNNAVMHVCVCFVVIYFILYPIITLLVYYALSAHSQA